MITTERSWVDANQRYLVDSLRAIRNHLEPEATAEEVEPIWSLEAPPAIERVATLFGLSPFERDLLLMCAGVELDARFASACGRAQGSATPLAPTFGLALAVLPGAHWSALSPDAPLRFWRLVELGTGTLLATSPLRIDERILHALAGVDHLDERLRAIGQVIGQALPPMPSHEVAVERLTAAWSEAAPTDASPIELCGPDPAAKQAVARAAASRLGLVMLVVPVHALPPPGPDLELLVRLLAREGALANRALYLDADSMDAGDALKETSIQQVMASVHPWAVVSLRELRALGSHPVLGLHVNRPGADEQLSVWRQMLGPAAAGLNGQLDAVVSQFNLSALRIESASRQALAGQSLWEACREQARPGLDDLAQRIEPAATWSDLVLPQTERELLRQLAAHVRHRSLVYRRWGFAARSSRGLGISALFVGASGTGKTMAAEVLANELHLDLYRIDLSAVVSKYIGETEKNLRRVFDAADEGGAILLFDEADALFGKRSEVRDSHDRYANIEISYLLQRMETYRGLAILTSNMRHAIDPAFLRRIRFIVNFPFPDAVQRAEIWARIFPADTPTDGLDVIRLSRLNATGGTIRNIALNAAFLAADASEPVRMAHLARAARTEHVKLERPMIEAEVADWT